MNNEKEKLFSGARREWKFVLKFIIFSLVFWLAEFAYQFYFLLPGELERSLIRSFGITGATFFGLTLFSSILFKFKPRYGKFWYIRRSLGVMGFVFILFHVLSVTGFFYSWDLSKALYSLNLLQNPIIFGLIALPIFFLMFITSTDWASNKIGMRKWKALHRLVYFGYFASVMHYITIDLELFKNVAGAFLIIVTFLTLAGELYWFIQTIRKKISSSKGIIVGIIVIFLWLLFLYIAFLVPYLQSHI